jgi:hypothetical protein
MTAFSATAADNAHATDTATRQVGPRRTASDSAAASDVATRTNAQLTANVEDTAQAVDENTQVNHNWFASTTDNAPAIDSNDIVARQFLTQWTADVSQGWARSRSCAVAIRVQPEIVPTPPLTLVPR